MCLTSPGHKKCIIATQRPHDTPSTLDENDLNIPVRINNLARQTRRIAKITLRNNQPFFEEYVLKVMEKEGYCKIDDDDREVIFLKLPYKH